MGILSALALTLSWLESLIPSSPFMPPGAKPGLSNIAVMFAVSAMPLPYSFAIVGIKALFALVTRGTIAAMTSLFGGALSLLVMIALLRPEKQPLGLIGTGVLCALAHNIGQLAAAVMITQTVSLTAYLPALALFGIVAGSLTGCIFKAVNPVLIKQSSHFKRR